MKKHNFYIIRDEFFERFNDPYLKGNKEENRPHYYCFNDEISELYWVIPMSSGVNKYRTIIDNGYENDFSDERFHHEIYLSDARKTAPEKWKTVIRHPVKVQ